MDKGHATKVGLYLSKAVCSSDAIFDAMLPHCENEEQFIVEYILFKASMGFYSLVQLDLDSDPNYNLLVDIFQTGFNSTFAQQGLNTDILLYRVKYYFGARSTRDIASLFKEAAGVNGDVSQFENVVISMLNSYKTQIKKILAE